MSKNKSERQSYNEWRDQEVKKVGLPTQMKAEAILDKHEKTDFVEMIDPKTGNTQHYRKHIADILKKKGKLESVKKSFSVPSIPGFTDK